MNYQLVLNWNETITDDDTVYFLGDFSMRCSQELAFELYEVLNGNKIFLRGNHDIRHKLIPFIDKRELVITHNGQKISLSHYPLEEFEGDFNIHGHCHNNIDPQNLRDPSKYFNACVEMTEYKPILLNEIIISINKFRKHHDETI